MRVCTLTLFWWRTTYFFVRWIRLSSNRRWIGRVDLIFTIDPFSVMKVITDEYTACLPKICRYDFVVFCVWVIDRSWSYSVPICLDASTGSFQLVVVVLLSIQFAVVVLVAAMKQRKISVGCACAFLFTSDQSKSIQLNYVICLLLSYSRILSVFDRRIPYGVQHHSESPQYLLSLYDLTGVV